MNEVTITAAEYKELVEAQASIRAFARYVNGSEYSISREHCADILGFELAEAKGDGRED